MIDSSKVETKSDSGLHLRLRAQYVQNADFSIIGQTFPYFFASLCSECWHGAFGWGYATGHAQRIRVELVVHREYRLQVGMRGGRRLQLTAFSGSEIFLVVNVRATPHKTKLISKAYRFIMMLSLFDA